MLSKSAAKAFFITGTVLCGGAFILLTLDTIKQVPLQTNENMITEPVKRGKDLWDHNNCMGCHTILGEGAYYAPELTKVIDRRGETFVRAMLKDPEAMYPGQRKMVNYHFKDEEISDLVEFLKWIGKMDLNGYPAKPNLGAVADPNANSASIASSTIAVPSNRPAIFNQMCIACHTLQGQGGKIGPALDDVGSLRDRDYIAKWLKDPASLKADSKMPKLPLSEADITELSAFLSQQKGAAK